MAQPTKKEIIRSFFSFLIQIMNCRTKYGMLFMFHSICVCVNSEAPKAIFRYCVKMWHDKRSFDCDANTLTITYYHRKKANLEMSNFPFRLEFFFCFHRSATHGAIRRTICIIAPKSVLGVFVFISLSLSAPFIPTNAMHFWHLRRFHANPVLFLVNTCRIDLRWQDALYTYAALGTE